MFNFVLSALLASSLVAAAPLRRTVEPRTYAQDADLLEPYHQYNTRYIALSCQTQHGKAFFDSCCHPLLLTEKLSDRPANCTPTPTASTSAAAVDATQIPPPGAVSDDDGDDDDDANCDDSDDDDYESSSVVASTYVPKTSSAAPVTSAAHTHTYSHPAPVTTHSAAAPVTTHSAAPATTTKAPAAPATTSKAAAATTKASAPANSGNAVQTGGFATWFVQGGNAGACGTVHSDNDLIVAIDEQRYGDSSEKSALCGKQVRITNTNNGKTVTATIADDCPSCRNGNSIDLSKGTFLNIATLDDGEVPITWTFV